MCVFQTGARPFAPALAGGSLKGGYCILQLSWKLLEHMASALSKVQDYHTQ